jgi:hypothetical protein
MIVLVRLEHVGAKHQYNLEKDIRQVFELDNVASDVFGSILDSYDMQNPSPNR